MPIKTPDFWYRDANTPAPINEALLLPFSLIYQIAHRINQNIITTKSVEIPVICVGNITAGGSGKTPTSIAINKLIIKNNIAKTPYFLTRGYGGNNNSTRLITAHDDAKETGDEPLLLATHSKTIISRDRYNGALLAHDLGADLIIMDDGLQNQTLKKDISFLVIDGVLGFGNGKTLPSGPLRESLSYALNRIDAVIIIGSDTRGIKSTIPKDIPIFSGHIKPVTEKMPDKSKQYTAFCGLAYPDKFFNTLKDNGYKVIESLSFSDHHDFSEAELKRIKKSALDNDSSIITTEKDYIRLPKTFRNDVETLPIELEFANEDKLSSFIKGKLKQFKEK